MRLNYRHLEGVPYLSLFIVLAALVLVPTPVSYYALLLIPIAMAAGFHQFIGGLLAALTSVVGVTIFIQLETAVSDRLLMWQSAWPVLLVFVVVGPGLGLLVARERERERQRVHQLETKRAGALAAIHDAGREIAATLNLERTLRQVMLKAAETLPMDAGILFLRDEASQMHRAVVSHNLPSSKVEEITFSFDEGVPGWVVKHRQPLIINDATADARVHAHVVQTGVMSVLATPLVMREQIVGVLNLFCRQGPDAFDDDALKLAQVFADQAAVFIENARLVDELRQAAAALEDRVEQRTQQLQQKQAQVIRAEKMAAVGRLAASIAHEINNPLQAIALHLDLIADDGPDVSEKQMTIVQQELDRIAGIVQRLLDFQRPKHGHRAVQKIQTLLFDVFALVGKQLQQVFIEVDCEVDEGLPAIIAVGDQIKQVFLNLVLNAVEAMPEGGKLIIRATQQDGMIAISFTDTGPGIDADVMPKLFEPFFSTKHTGSGLGLAVSQEIITNHGGTLTAVNPGSPHADHPGATFLVMLPVVEISRVVG